MGNFSREKINEVIAFLNDKNSDKFTLEYVRKFIKIVDEPVLKWKLEEMYLEKYNENSVEESIEAQIKYLQMRLREIRNDSN